MTSGGEKCGLISLLPMACRERTEAFARRLHSRLTSLGSEEDDSLVSENSWLTSPRAGHDNSLTTSQPKLAPDSDLYVNTLESPGSPALELDDVEIERLINKDNLILFHPAQYSTTENPNLLNHLHAAANESDSGDETFCDSHSDLQTETEKCNGISKNNLANKSLENDLNTVDKEKVETCEECSNTSSELANNDTTIINGNDTYPSVIVEEQLTSECLNNTLEESPSPQGTRELREDSLRPDNHEDEDADEHQRIPRVRRCSSLKTGKTPPGTPGQKKIVRFADVLGLDLADVRTFLDEIPKVPNSAYQDLKEADLKSSVSDSMLNRKIVDDLVVDKMLSPMFQQPGGQPQFIDRLRENQICLDNAMVDDNFSLAIRGIVRVKNLDFNKSVHVRYTLDSWQTYADVQAVYVENSCDGFSDKFSFMLFCNTLKLGQKLEFAIRFQCKGCQYWDNNFGKNYCFQCLPATNHTSCAPVSVCEDNWTNFY